MLSSKQGLKLFRRPLNKHIMSTEWLQVKDLKCLISDLRVLKDYKMLKVHLDSMIKTKELLVLKDGKLNKR